MVSSSQVNSDSSSLVSVLSEYDSVISELGSGWKGLSYDNLCSKASEFSSDYSSKVKDQMTYFANACDLYKRYKIAKENLEIAKENFNLAMSNNDDSNKTFYSNKVSEYRDSMDSLKSQIENNLQAAISAGGGVAHQSISSILANATETIKQEQAAAKAKEEAEAKAKAEAEAAATAAAAAAPATASGVAPGVQGAMDWAIGIANDNTHGYSQGSRWGSPDYDCSSLLIQAYQNAGIPVKDAGATYTGNMIPAFQSCGFTWIPGNPSVESLQPGDVLLNIQSHTEMYVGNGQLVGAHFDGDGYSGDATGDEINVGGYYDYPWDGVLRYTGDVGKQ